MANRLLERTRIKGTELNVPFLTVGTMMFGGRADRQESERIVNAALDHGLTFFDTADLYEDGTSETFLGAALKGRRDQCIVATKVGYGKTSTGEEEGLAPESIRRGIDQSLSNLSMDYVDVYYLHRPDSRAPIEESLGTLVDLIDQGKIRHFGISNFGAWQTYEVLQVCARNRWPAPVMTQMIYNVLLRQIEYEYVALCRKKELHLTVYNPLAGGLLTGKYASMHDESAGGRFVSNVGYRKRYWTQRFFNGMLALKAIAERYGIRLTHLAINWVSQRGNVGSVLLGPSNAAQVLDCIAAGENPIPPEAMAEIDDFLVDYEGTNACYAR